MKINETFKNLLMPLKGEEKAALEESIIESGCLAPLIVWQEENTLIDGHNRLAICEKHGFRYETTELSFNSESDVINWIIDNQLSRRNITPEQASYLRGKRYNLEKRQDGGHGDQKSGGNSCTPKKTDEKLADEFKISPRTIKNDAKYAEAIDALTAKIPDIKDDILTRETPITKKETVELAEMVKEKPEQAKAIVEAVKTGKAKNVKSAKREIRKEEALKNVKDLPQDKYKVIYADPPWRYNDKCDSGAIQAGGCEKHYPSMSKEELCDMDIKSLCADNAVLFLWATSPLLPESLDVIKAWGFKYKASFVWHKKKHNMGHYNSVRHEFLFIATKGSCTPENVKLFPSVQEIERTEHSVKPEEFRNIIDTLYPTGKRIELFARKKTEHWDVWGAES